MVETPREVDEARELVACRKGEGVEKGREWGGKSGSSERGRSARGRSEWAAKHFEEDGEGAD
jgi:hypothetical protein